MAPGIPFGRYTLQERIAVGGMAEIFRATTSGLGGFEKLVAIKRLHPQYSQDQKFVDMLIDEAKITVRLHHPNIVEVLDLGEIDNHFYIAMEHIEGHDLFHVLKKLYDEQLQMPLEAAVYLTQEILSGLHYAHFRRDENRNPLRIIHRDVSPQNILVSYEGEVKLIDFGIVKAEKRLTETASGIIKGKFYYMSPEQANGLELDHRSDLFSVGIVLYESLIAAPLYDDDEDSGTLLTRVQAADVAPPTTTRGDIPADLEEIVMRALCADRDERFQTALEFHRALSEFLVRRRSNFNRMDFALFLRQLMPQARENVPTSLDPIEVDHARARQSVPVDPSAPLPGVSPASGLRRAESYRSSETQLSGVLLQPNDTHREMRSLGMEAQREERLRLALVAVVLAIILVCAAIFYVLQTTPDLTTPMGSEQGAGGAVATHNSPAGEGASQ